MTIWQGQNIEQWHREHNYAQPWKIVSQYNVWKKSINDAGPPLLSNNPVREGWTPPPFALERETGTTTMKKDDPRMEVCIIPWVNICTLYSMWVFLFTRYYFFEIIAVKKVFNWNPLNWLNSLLEKKKEVFGEKAKDEKSWRLKSKAGSWKGNAKF